MVQSKQKDACGSRTQHQRELLRLGIFIRYQKPASERNAEYKEHETVKEKILQVIKIIGIVVFFPLILLGWLVSCLINQIVRAINRKLVETPLDRFIEVDGHRMSVLVTGQGAHTIVFLPGLCRTCPILDFKPVFSRLEDEFRIVVPEKFGYGLSDIVKENRDFETIVEQYRKALSILEIKPPYILCAHSLSGHDVELWAQKYPDEVELFIGFDTNLSTCPELDWITEKQMKRDAFVGWIYRTAGWTRFDGLYGLDKALTKQEVRIIRELECRNTENPCIQSEERNYLAAHRLIQSMPLPTMPTLQFVDAPEWYKNGVEEPHEPGDRDDELTTWIKPHQEYVAASRYGKLICRTGGHVMHHYDYVEMAQQIKEFTAELWT